MALSRASTATVAAESGGKRSRWDETPMVDSGAAAGGATPVGGFGGATPLGLADAMTPTPTSFAAQSAAALALDRLGAPRAARGSFGRSGLLA